VNHDGSLIRPRAASARVEPRHFRSGRTFFYLRTFLLLIAFTALLLFVGIQTVTPQPWIVLLGAILAVYLLVVGLSPLLTRHTLTGSRLILRQGWYFRAALPLGDAESIGPYDGEAKYGLRLAIGRRTLFVVGSTANLVGFRLKEPRRFPQVLFLKATEVVFDVDDRDAFLAAVEDRVTASEPLPARKIPILPRARR